MATLSGRGACFLVLRPMLLKVYGPKKISQPYGGSVTDAGQLRTTARTRRAGLSIPGGCQASRRIRASWGALTLAPAVSVGSTVDSSRRRARPRAAPKVSIRPEGAATTCPGVRFQEASREAEDAQQIHEFAETWTKLDTVRAGNPSFCSPASGNRFRGLFFDHAAQRLFSELKWLW